MVVIGVTVAFLTGSALLFVAGTGQTQDIAADFDTPGYATGYDSVEAAQSDHPDAAILSTAQVQLDGSSVRVLGVPSEANATIATATPSRGLASTERTTEQSVRVVGQALTTTVRVTTRPAVDTVSGDWYFGNRSFVDRLGTDGAFVLHPEQTDTDGGTSTPLRAAALFFINGTRQALSLFGVLAGGVAVLVTVIVFSVTRMSTQDRHRSIKIVRATGGTPGSVRRLFTLRAIVVTVVGVTLGYAGGLIATRTAVNLGVFLGLPVSLDVSLSAASLGLLVPLYTGLLVLGGVAGYVAAWPVSRGPPADVSSRVATPARKRLAGVFDLTLLRWRALVPTVGTVTVFLTFLLLLVSLVAVAGPVVDSNTATVVEPDAVHPVASNIPEAYASVLENRGIEASPEILLFPVVDEQPMLVRGAKFASFAAVSNATITDGATPSNLNEAIIGESAARFHDIDVGETLLVGGSTRSALTSVRVVGTFDAPGFYDDHLLVSLPTARHLSTKDSDQVHVVRATRLPESGGEALDITDVRVPAQVVSNTSVEISATAVNLARSPESQTVAVTFGEANEDITFTLEPGGQQTRRVTLPAPQAGTRTLRVGSLNRTVTVVPADLLTVSVPRRVPPGSEPLVQVETASGTPIANATVTLGSQSQVTGSDGTARLVAPANGTHRVIVEANGQTSRQKLTVTDAVSGETEAGLPRATLTVQPDRPSFQTRPQVTLRLSNPWRDPLSVNATLTSPQRELRRMVALSPGETTSVRVRLARNPPGEYELTATTDTGTVLAQRTLRITGSGRLVAALATHGERTSTPFSQAVSMIFGNLQLLVAAVMGLGAVMTVGGLTATFARGVHSRKRTIGIYRATGAPAWRILYLVCRDALRIGTVATTLGFALSYALLAALSEMGALAVFGIVVEPTLSVGTVALGFGVVLSLIVVGAGLATIRFIRASPASTLENDQARRGRQ